MPDESTEFTLERCPYSALTVIAQDDDNDYEESGYIAVVFGDRAAISEYSHCSCYGTWAVLADGGRFDFVDKDQVYEWGWNWTGTIDELVEIAKNRLDYVMLSRKIDPNDYNYDHLSAVYDQIVEWNEKRTKN